ncbi:MAG: hypothetical protein V4864_07400 [Pseudomonadota bacterium]
MQTHNPKSSPHEGGEPSGNKKPYVKPAFRHERVFETMALACGKISTTQSSCRASRKNS